MRNLATDLDGLVARFERELGALSDEALDRRPHDGGWSAREVMAHLQVTVGLYLDRLQPLLARPHGVPARGPAADRGTWVGRKLLGALQAKGRRLRAPRSFRPGADVRGDLGALLRVHRRLADVARELHVRGLGSRRIATPVSRLLRLSARQAVEAMVVHGRRHLAQALEAARASRT